jgi:hypothetical protein
MMKVVYFFNSVHASLILEKMIIPQISGEDHGADVVGMFFLGDTTYFFLPDNPIGEQLSRLSSKYGFFIVCCDYCCEQRRISGRLYPGAQEGCFPDVYRKAQERGAEQVICL